MNPMDLSTSSITTQMSGITNIKSGIQSVVFSDNQCVNPNDVFHTSHTSHTSHASNTSHISNTSHTSNTTSKRSFYTIKDDDFYKMKWQQESEIRKVLLNDYNIC